MLTKKLQAALNDHINHEFHAAYTYLSMAAYFHSINLDGFAHWMMLQREEEIGHGMKIYDFIHDRDGRVELNGIEKPPTEFKSPLDVMEKALAHERKVTGKINDLYEMAVAETDYPTQTMLQWFITEQVEEEANAGKIIEQLKMIGDDKIGLIMLDREMGERTSAE